MTLFRNFFSCVRGHRAHHHQRVRGHRSGSTRAKVKLGVPLKRLCGDGRLAGPVLRLVTFLAREGAHANDLFRRPGNMSQVTAIIKLLGQGKTVQWAEYNLYTAANVAKKILLSIPGGLFGRHGEALLLATADQTEESRTCEFLSLVREMDAASRELTVILFGILFRMVTHAVTVHCASIQQQQEQKELEQKEQENVNESAELVSSEPVSESTDASAYKERQAVLSEAVAKSVAGSLFHTCRDSPAKIEAAVPILQTLILAFPSFDLTLIDFFDQAVNKLSLSNSSTGSSSHELSLSGPSKMPPRKPSGLAASLEMWTGSLAKSASQRSSLKDATALPLRRPPQQQPHGLMLSPQPPLQLLQQQQQAPACVVPSITVTGPPDEPSPALLPRAAIVAAVVPVPAAPSPVRSPHDRLRSMKRRQLANQTRRSEWFLAEPRTPCLELPFYDDDEDDAQVGDGGGELRLVVVTCGGSSICLGQAHPLYCCCRDYQDCCSSGDICSSGPLTSPVVVHYEDPLDLDQLDQPLHELFDEPDQGLMIITEPSGDQMAPNSVPLIRRLLPSTSSRKSSVHRDPNPLNCPDDDDHCTPITVLILPGSSSPRLGPTSPPVTGCGFGSSLSVVAGPTSSTNNDEDDDDDLHDTQSNYY